MSVLPSVPYAAIERIIALRAQGFTAAAIGSEVGLHPQTVRLYREEYRCPVCDRYIREDATLCGDCRRPQLKTVNARPNPLYRR